MSTFLGERPLAPDFGIFDPVAVGTSTAEVTAAVDLCEPDLRVVDVTIRQVEDQQQVAVTWRGTTREKRSDVRRQRGRRTAG